jgi:hypothetical protein
MKVRRAALTAAFGLLAAGLCGLGPAGVTSASAKTGDLTYNTTFASPCAPQGSVGIAFDGTYLWYSCGGATPDLYRADPLTGANEGSWNIAGGLGSIAYDANHNAIWAGWVNGAATGDVTYIPLDSTQNVDTASVAVKFNVGTSMTTNGLDDGIAYDAFDDSLFISPDMSQTIYHFSASGTFLDSRPWVGAIATAPSVVNTVGHFCFNSGLAIGGPLLFEAANGEGYACNTDVLWADRHSNAYAGQLPTTGELEGLACDPTTFFPKDVIWAVKNDGTGAWAKEIPPTTCGIGGRGAGPLADAYMVNASVADGSGNVIAAVNAAGDARTNAGEADNAIQDVALPGGLGEVTVGADTSYVSNPFDGTASATAKVSSVTLNIPAVPGVAGTPCQITATGIVASVQMTASSAGGPYTTSVGPSTTIASLNVCGHVQKAPIAPANILLPNGIGRVATFEQVANGDGTSLAELEIDALHVYVTINGATTEVVVGSAYVGQQNGGMMSPRPPTSPTIASGLLPPVPSSPPSVSTGPGGTVTGGCRLDAVAVPTTTSQLVGTVTEASVTQDQLGLPLGATVGCFVRVAGVQVTREFEYPGSAGVQSGANAVQFDGSPADVIDVCKEVWYIDGKHDLSCAFAQWSANNSILSGEA